MKKLIMLIFFTSFISCVTFKNSGIEIFQKKGKDFLYVLELKAIDSTFSFSQKYFEGTASCQGKWSKKENIIILNCNEVKSFTEKLSSGYMSKRNYTLKIINKNTLQLDNIKLEKVKQ